MNSFTILFSLIFLNFHSIHTLVRKNGKHNHKRPVLKQSLLIQSTNVLNWSVSASNQFINLECNVDLDSCNQTFNPFTTNYCQILTQFKTPVCGGLSCYFNETNKKCDGQCSNTILQTCVSKVSNPTENSDCVCASSRVVTDNNNNFYCDKANCYSNSCSLTYFLINRISDGSVYAICNNDH